MWGLSMKLNHPRFVLPHSACLCPDSLALPLPLQVSFMWVPRTPSREHLAVSHSQRPYGSFKSYLENLTVFCVTEAGNFCSSEEFY